ncbi:MAG: UvrD-helicase domain-containing protein [Verrucomicrobiota bacterium]|jgi:ATP-dependent helicase/nuclease subunit A
MEPPRTQNDSLTPSQRQAVAARGNVLVMAGAGTGKTHTLVERCLHCLCAEQPPASLEEILVVTFTEAAAAEMRRRLREQLEEKLRAAPDDPRWTEQIALFDTAHIGTLHSFCLKLVREHFHELGLDPQLAVLDAGEARLLADETLEEELQEHYAGQDELAEAVQKLIQIYGGGRDQAIRQLVLRLHHYAQTCPDADGWLARQIEHFASPAPEEWRKWLLDGIRNWRDEWLPVLEKLGAPGSGTARSSKHAGPEADAPSANEKAAELADILRRLPNNFLRADAAGILGQIISADDNWPAKRKTALRKPLEKFFDAAAFLHSLAPVKDDRDPLVEDWDWVRGHMSALVRLTQNFSARFAARKRDDGVLDFHDLEQFALKLLWNFAANQPTPVAGRWRQKIRYVFVDEYQDINAAQDKIIQALSRDSSPSPRPSGERAGERGAKIVKTAPHPAPLLLRGGEGEKAQSEFGGNRFLVGDVKQSIYRFRLADPKIFRDYAQSWRGNNGQTISLAENFRSREGLLNFVNSVFEPLMREEIGGVRYDTDARLQFGAPDRRTELSATKNVLPRAELLLRFKKGRNEAESGDESGNDDLADLQETEKEARLLALRLKRLAAGKHEIWDTDEKGFRPAEWRDMAVLLRAPSGKAEIYAKEFQRAGVPLVVERGGFYDSNEIMDLLSLLQLLDNPLQDVPAIAVLRSPLAGLSLDELARIRLAAKDVHFWTALNRWRDVIRAGGRVTGLEATAEIFPKVDKFLENFSRWRQLARQASLSQCLESVLAETHYAEWLLARSRGAQRRANVERFLGLAEKFDQFQRQGLFRFLKFIEAQREAEVEPEVAAVTDENAVRLMSIHQSKGLEFPIVAVADLAKPFNTQDLRGEIIFDETFGLCPRIKPPRTGRQYPSLPHWLAQQHQRREQWGEELRLLYVALTRARDTLVLTAAVSEKKWESLWIKSEAVTTQAIITAKSYADWLGLWFAQYTGGTKATATKGEWPHLRWRLTEDAELADEVLDEPAEKELPPLDDKTRRQLRETLVWQYLFAAATQRAAKSSVTALRRQAAGELDDEAEQIFTARNFARAARRNSRTKLSAADAGTAHHKFLQHVALENVNNVAVLKSEANRLEQKKVLSVDERAALVLENIAAFWNSGPGQKIRAQAASVRRELAFTARFSPAELAAITGAKSAPGLEDEFVVVQGVADLVVLLPEEIWLADFKTDEIRQDGLPDKIKAYAPQLKLYAQALEKIYSRPVTERWLHFLSARKTVNLAVGR